MLIYEYKQDGNQAHYAAIDEAIRIVQFIRNKCLRLWMDEHTTKNEVQCSCAVLAKEHPFASHLNSQARQASADSLQKALSTVGQTGCAASALVESLQSSWGLRADTPKDIALLGGETQRGQEHGRRKRGSQKGGMAV